MRGHTVSTPTLTGQGERSHLIAGTVNLSTHITDILNVTERVAGTLGSAI